MPTDLDLLLYLQDQVLTRAQALRHLSAGAVRHLLASGRWQVAHLGIYVAHNGPLTDGQRRLVAVLASRGYVAGLSALILLGLRGFATPQLHLLVPGHRRDDDPPPSVRIHRTGALPHSERGMVDNLPCTVPARAVVDAAQWAVTDEQAATIVAASVQQRLVTVIDVRLTLDRIAARTSTRTGRRAPGRPRRRCRIAPGGRVPPHLPQGRVSATQASGEPTGREWP